MAEQIKKHPKIKFVVKCHQIDIRNEHLREKLGVANWCIESEKIIREIPNVSYCIVRYNFLLENITSTTTDLIRHRRIITFIPGTFKMNWVCLIPNFSYALNLPQYFLDCT